MISVKSRRILLEHFGERFGCAPSLGPVLVEQAVERRLEAQLLAVDGESQRRHGLVEQAVPGAARGHRLLVEELLELVVELVGLLLAEVFDPRQEMPELRIRHRRLERRVVEPVQLEPEEEKLRRDRGDLLLDVAVEFLPLGVRSVGGVEQPRIGYDAAKHVVEMLELPHGPGELGTALAAVEKRGKLAGITRLHRVRGLL